MIITSIDNSNKFAWLCENYEDAEFVAIQNGFRLSYDAKKSMGYYCQHLFCFGQREIDFFKNLNYKVDKFYPVGSLNLSENFRSEMIDAKPRYDLLIVSCWRGNIGCAEDVVDSMKGMHLMDQAIADYLRKRNLKAAVILRSERNSVDWTMNDLGISEETYFKNIYGRLVDIIDVDFSKRNIYPVMQSANLVIASFGTTTLIEAYALGKKILYLDFIGKNDYFADFDNEIVFQCLTRSARALEMRLDKMIKQDEKEYQSDNKEKMKYYCNWSKDRSTRSDIKRQIKEMMENRELRDVN